jgi:hypothetical protein
MTKIIYNYSSVTGEFLNQVNADASPLDPGSYLIPANATDIPPPALKTNQVAVFLNGAWAIQPDFRGTTYWLADGTQAIQQTIGALPAGSTLVKPAATLAQAQQSQVAIISAACAAAITGGFQSSALGNAYTYPSTQTDQSNLNANVVSSLLPNLPSNWTTLQLCMDSKGNWAYLPHTATQIQQVGSDGKAAILPCLTRNATLQAQVAAATTVAAVQAINF